METKQQILKAIEDLPDDAGVEDALDRLYLLYKVQGQLWEDELLGLDLRYRIGGTTGRWSFSGGLGLAARAKPFKHHTVGPGFFLGLGWRLNSWLAVDTGYQFMKFEGDRSLALRLGLRLILQL